MFLMQLQTCLSQNIIQSRNCSRPAVNHVLNECVMCNFVVTHQRADDLMNRITSQHQRLLHATQPLNLKNF